MNSRLHKQAGVRRPASSLFLLSAIAAVCMAGAVLAFGRSAAEAEKSEAAANAFSQARNSVAVKPFTLVDRRFFTSAGGTPILRAVRERRQFASGWFLLTETYYRPDNSVESSSTGLGRVGGALFRFNEADSTLEFLGPAESEETATEEQLRSDPHFNREESVAGQRVMVARYPRGRDDSSDREVFAGESYREVFRAPALLGFPIKTVDVSPRGEETTEVERLEEGEPDAGPLHRMAGYARSFTRYEERIRLAERRGETGRAELLRGSLTRARQ